MLKNLLKISMPTLSTLFASVFCLALPVVLAGCGDIQETSEGINPLASTQALPADDDIIGLYNLDIPDNWETTEDPVLYTKYLRAKLLRKFGNIPEVHIVADMELQKRQSPDSTLNEPLIRGDGWVERPQRNYPAAPSADINKSWQENPNSNEEAIVQVQKYVRIMQGWRSGQECCNKILDAGEKMCSH